MSIYNLISLIGIGVFVLIAWLLSADRKNFNTRVVVWGVALQLVFAGFIFVVPAGAKIFMFLNDLVLQMLDAAAEGGKFLFGPLALPPGTSEGGTTSIGFILAFQALPTIIFFASLLGVLYYYGIIPKMIELFAYVFSRWMKISGAESLAVTSNIFVGLESALTVKPYLEKMTKSELCTILAAMMGTIASSTMAIYVMALQPLFNNIAGHLVSASILSVPAAVIMAKIMLPESEKPVTLGEKVKVFYERENNPVEAAVNGAMAGGKMLFGVVVLLIAFIGLVALVNKITVFGGGGLNNIFGTSIDFTLQGLLGYVCYPLTLAMGVNPVDAFEVAKLIGERAFVTEIPAYFELAQLMKDNVLVDPRSAMLASYALCGYAHIASMGIFVGGMSALVPGKIRELTEVGFRALIAATLGCMMTACVAGVFLTGSSILIR